LPHERDVTFSRLQADIQRDEDGDLYLPTVDPDTFQRLLDFLYQGVVPEITEAWIMERRLYHLADIFGCTELMNRLLDTLQEYQLATDQHFTIREVAAVLPTLGGISLWGYCMAGIACQLAWDLYDEVDHRDLNALINECPQVAADVLRIQLKRGKAISSRTVDYRRSNSNGFGRCEFHVHSSGDTCLPAYPEEAVIDEYGGEFDDTHFLGHYPVVPGIKIEDEGPKLGLYTVSRLGQGRRQRLKAGGRRRAENGISKVKRAPKLRNRARRKFIRSDAPSGSSIFEQSRGSQAW
jgi:hypothetical protein